MKRRLAILLLVALGLLAAPRSSSATYPRKRKDPHAIAFVVTGWKNSKPLDLADLRGQVVVLQFWATWCPVCKGQLPKFDALAQALAGRVVCIGVHVARKGNAMPAFMARQGFGFIACVDSDDRTTKGLGITTIPDNIIIDKWGRVRDHDVVLEKKQLLRLADEVLPGAAR